MSMSPSEDVCRAYAGISFKDKLVHKMSYVELSMLKERCAAYLRKCKVAQRKPHQNYVTLNNAVDFYIDIFTHKGIKHAYDQFSDLRREAQGLGYTVPSLFGAMDVNDIIDACAMVREAIAVTVGLPGEDPAMTKLIVAKANESLRKGIAALNRQYERDDPFKAQPRD